MEIGSAVDSEILAEIKPLGKNGLVSACRKARLKILGAWYGFSSRHPKGAKLLQKFFVMLVLSMGVTVYQMLVMMFLPYAFTGLWHTPFVWPAAALPITDAMGNSLNYAVFNEPVRFLLNGDTVLASTAEQVELMKNNPAAVYEISGLGNFIAFEIAVFSAQCINLPLQRNLTFHSNGNVWVQAFWYFVGWVLVSVGLNALWGIVNPVLIWWNWNKFVIDVIKTVLTGGVSMVIFFFIFLIIFPDKNKVRENAKRRLNAAIEKGKPKEIISALEKDAKEKERAADYENARLAALKTSGQAELSAIAFLSAVKNAEKLIEESGNLNAVSSALSRVVECREKAVSNIEARKKAAADFEWIKRDVTGIS